MISELFLTAATPGVVEPAAEVEVVAPESWSEDEDEPTATRSSVAPATKQKSKKKIASSFNKVRSNTKLQKNIQDSLDAKEKLCETSGEEAFQVKSRSHLFILTFITPGDGIEQ